jgi:hypothetical protein
MFEGKPPRPDEESPAGPKADRDALRPLEWAELASRLAAARDLRASLLGDGAAGEASFDAGSARRIAAHHGGKGFGNPEDLANGKGHGSTRPEALLARRRGAARE